jgi:hypothetical protein
MLSDELFLNAELNEKIGLKSSKKGPEAPVIDIAIRDSHFEGKMIYKT